MPHRTNEDRLVEARPILSYNYAPDLGFEQSIDPKKSSLSLRLRSRSCTSHYGVCQSLISRVWQ